MAYFARIGDDGIVEQVIVCESEALCVKLLGGTWVETKIDGNYAGRGYTYYPDVKAFCPKQPFPSWTIAADKTRWTPPLKEPRDGLPKRWAEDSQQWVDLDEQTLRNV